MQREYKFSRWELYLQFIVALLMPLLFLFTGGFNTPDQTGDFIFLLIVISISIGIIVINAMLYPVHAIVDGEKVTFFMLYRSITVPIKDLYFPQLSNGSLLAYRGGFLFFSVMATNHDFWDFIKDLHLHNNFV